MWSWSLISYVAGEFYFGTNAARLENVFRTPEHFDAVHAILRNSSRSCPVFSPSPILPEVKTETRRLNRATHGILILKTIIVRDGLIRMSDLAPDDLLQHTACSEP